MASVGTVSAAEKLPVRGTTSSQRASNSKPPSWFARGPEDHSSFVAQRHHGINAGRAPRWYVARGRGHDHEDRAGRGERPWIARAHAEQQAGQETSERERSQHSDSEAQARECHATAETSRNWSHRLAPSAALTPISWARCATEYEITP
jgi:hypothetical protein